MLRGSLALAAAAASLVLPAAAVAAPPPGVKLIDLGVEGRAASITATDMNDAGTVVGIQRGAVDEVAHIVIWKDRKIQDLGTAHPLARANPAPAPEIGNDGTVLAVIRLPDDRATCGFACYATMRYAGGSWRRVDDPGLEGNAFYRHLVGEGDIVGTWTFRDLVDGNFPWDKLWVARSGDAWAQLTEPGVAIDEEISDVARSGYVLTLRAVPGPPQEAHSRLRVAPAYAAVDLPTGHTWGRVMSDGRVVGAKFGDPTPLAWNDGAIEPFPVANAIDAQRTGVLGLDQLPLDGGGVVFHARLYRPAGAIIDLDTWRPAGAPWDGLVLNGAVRLTPGGEMLLKATGADGTRSIVVLRRTVISGSIAGAPGAATTTAAARLTVVATGPAGTFTTTAAAGGRFDLEVVPGRYRLAVQGRSGCVVAAGRCAASQLVDATRDASVRLLADKPGVRLALGVVAGARLAVAGGRVAIPLRCVAGAPCRGTLRIRAGRRVVAVASVRLAAGAGKVVRLAVGARRGAVTVVASAGGATASARVTLAG